MLALSCSVITPTKMGCFSSPQIELSHWKLLCLGKQKGLPFCLGWVGLGFLLVCFGTLLQSGIYDCQALEEKDPLVLFMVTESSQHFCLYLESCVRHLNAFPVS